MHIIGRYLLVLNTQHDSDNVHSPLTEYGTWYKNESTAGADASVEALKLYDMKLLTLALAYSNT